MNRREAIKVTGQIVGATLLIPRQELLSRLSIALNKPSSLDLTTLHHLEILTAGYWKLLPDITGIVSGDLLRFVLGHLENVTTLLESVQPITLHKRLCCMASETSQIAGRMLFDMQNYAAAEAYYRISIEAAQQSGNHALWAVALGHMGFLRTYNGQPHLAIPFLQEAHRLAAQSATGTTRSWLAAVEAEAQANRSKLNRDFNTTLCFRALEKAELASNPEKPGEDPYWTGFNHTRQEGYKGVCYVLLHQTDAALAVLNKALGNLDPSSTYPRSVILTDLGTVHVQREEIEEACKYGGQALAITAESKSPIVLHRLFAFRRQLNAWKNVSAVIQFDEQMRFVVKQVMGKAS